MIRLFFENIALARGLFERRHRAYIALAALVFSVSACLQVMSYLLDSAQFQKQVSPSFALIHMMNPVMLWLGASTPSIISVLYYRVLLVRNPWNASKALSSFGRAFLLSLAFALVVMACDIGVKVLLMPLGTSIFFVVSVFSALIKVWLWLYVFSAYVLVCGNHGLRMRESIRIARDTHIETTIYVILASVVVGFVCLICADVLRMIIGVFTDISSIGVIEGVLITFEFVLREAIMCVVMAGVYRAMLNRTAK